MPIRPDTSKSTEVRALDCAEALGTDGHGAFIGGEISPTSVLRRADLRNATLPIVGQVRAFLLNRDSSAARRECPGQMTRQVTRPCAGAWYTRGELGAPAVRDFHDLDA